MDFDTLMDRLHSLSPQEQLVYRLDGRRVYGIIYTYDLGLAYLYAGNWAKARKVLHLCARLGFDGWHDGCYSATDRLHDLDVLEELMESVGFAARHRRAAVQCKTCPGRVWAADDVPAMMCLRCRFLHQP